jgi:hypothetical protein
LVLTFQLIFLYHTDRFAKMEFENAVFSISASTNFGLLFHILLLEDSMPTSFLRYHDAKMATVEVSSQLDTLRKPTALAFFGI